MFEISFFWYHFFLKVNVHRFTRILIKETIVWRQPYCGHVACVLFSFGNHNSGRISFVFKPMAMAALRKVIGWPGGRSGRRRRNEKIYLHGEIESC
jgi:hypothetical protein